MRQRPPTYNLGLEFHHDLAMGLCGIQNDESGTSFTYQYLSSEEAADWLATWLKGEKWTRSPHSHRRSMKATSP